MKRPAENARRSVGGKPLLTLLLLLGVCLFAGGCDLKMPWDPKPKPKTEAEAPADEGGGESEPPTPVNELDFLPPDMKKLPFEEVNIPTHDGLVIYGRLYDPSLKPEGADESAAADSTSSDGETEYKGPKYPLVILLHGLDRDHTTWSNLPVSLVKAGYAVFAIDLRGHGKSTTTVHQRRVTWRLFQPEHWKQMSKDVDEVIQFFQKSEDHPEVDGKNTALMGAKLGANVAVFSARDMQPVVKAMVLISPGLDYKGIIPSEAIIDYTNPALLITTQDDPYSYKSTERLYNWLLGLKALQVYKKIGDGTDMLSHQSALGQNITEWLIHQMPSAAIQKPEPVETITVAPEAPTEDKAAAPTEGNAAKPATPPAKKASETPRKAPPKKPIAKPAAKRSKAKAPKSAPKTPAASSPDNSQPPIPGG